MTMTMTATEAAQQRLADADSKVRDLQARLRTGDTTVTAAELVYAKAELEHAALALDGAVAVEERERREAREQAGRVLHGRWSEDALAGLAEVEQKLVAAGQAVHAALDALDNLDQLRDGYKAKWTEHFRGDDQESEAAAAFKFGHSTSGEFGAIDQFHGVRKFDPLVLIAALVAEVGRGRDRGRMRSNDAVLWGQLQQSPYEVALRQLRTEIDHFTKKETE